MKMSEKNLMRETEELFVQMDWLLTTLLKLSRLDAGIVVFQSIQVNVSSLIKICGPSVSDFYGASQY